MLTLQSWQFTMVFILVVFHYIYSQMISSNFFNFDDFDAGNGGDLHSRIVGCTPLRLEDSHLSELRSLVNTLPDDVGQMACEEVLPEYSSLK